MTHVDSAGLQALEDLSGTLENDGITLHFARAKHPIADRVAERVTGARFQGHRPRGRKHRDARRSRGARHPVIGRAWDPPTGGCEPSMRRKGKRDTKSPALAGLF